MEIRNLNIKKGIIFLFLLCLNTATASTCNLGCKTSTGSILNYVPGHEYEYALETHLNVAVHNGTEQDKDTNVNNQLKLNANAKLHAHGNCVYSLQLNNVKVSSSVEGVAKQQLQHLQQPIYFSMENNGQVQPDLCIKNNDVENHYALNIKRAVVSLLQTHVGDTELQSEVDVYEYSGKHIKFGIRSDEQKWSRSWQKARPRPRPRLTSLWQDQDQDYLTKTKTETKTETQKISCFFFFMSR